MLNEKRVLGRAVILGAGVMGTGIAALLANLGWHIDLLDRVPEDTGNGPKARDRLAREGLERACAARPPHFALPEYAARIRVGNIEDHAGRMREADWVVEAVAEEVAAKQAALALAAAHVGPETIVTSNTSGLSLAGMSADCPRSFHSRFFGAHFFNPPRYMKPVELIPADDTDREVFEAFSRFADRVLGKRVILAKDTPGFISTRLGMYALAKTIEIAVERGLAVEQVDYLTGPLIGYPASGTFRLADLVGLDVLARIVDNLTTHLPEDRAYASLRLPDIVRRLVSEGQTGVKAGAGFYRREVGGGILALDMKTGDYRPRLEVDRYPGEVECLSLNKRLPRLWTLSPDHDGGFLRELLATTLGYAAGATPEVADRIVEVDDVLMGGFGREAGPFHMLDALGDIEFGSEVPELVSRLRASRHNRFYQHEAGHHTYFDFHTARMTALPRPPDVIILKDLERAGRTIMEMENAALVDLGRGAACLRWYSKLNVLEPEIVRFIRQAKERAERSFAALVVGGAGDHFSAGFDLSFFAARIEAKDWEGLDEVLRQFQETLLGLRYAVIPVVSAVKGYALGGGCEVMLHGSAVQASSECSIGLPEANAGLIPAGGGTVAMLRRALADVPPTPPMERADAYPFVRPLWDRLRLARFSSSADEARSLGYLQPSDGVTRHPDRLLHDAREYALALATSYHPLTPSSLPVMGLEGLARFRWEIHLQRRADAITEHDRRVAERLAWVLCGGELAHPVEVSEGYLLDREREAFLSLAGVPETLARIYHLLETGRPLRN